MQQRKGIHILAVAIALSAVAPVAYAQSEEGWSVDGGEARRDEIVRRYLSILAARPERGVIFDRLLQELGGGARFAQTLESMRARSDADPSSFADAMLLGHLLAHAEQLDDALAAYARASEAAPEDGRPFHARADVLRRLQRRDEAREAYGRALELAADDERRATLLRALADFAFDDRRWDEAGQHVEALIALDPRDPYVRMELAEVYTEYQRYPDALAQYEAVEELAGRDTRQRAMALRDQGDVLSLMGQGEDALARYQRAMRLVDEGYWLQRELEQRVIAVYRQEDRLPELLAEYEERWSRPNTRQALLLAGLYDEVGQLEVAEDVLRGATRRAPRSVELRLALIGVLERRGAVDGVIAEYETLRRLEPRDTSFGFRLVDLYRRLGRRDDALALLNAMGRAARANPYILLEVADRYLRLDARDAALEMYERVVEVAPDDPDNLIALGGFHFMDGRRSEAERTWRRLLDVVEEPAAAHALLGNVFAENALYEEALEAFAVARELRPEDDGLLREVASLYERVEALPVALRLWEQLHARTTRAQMRVEARAAMVRLYGALGRLRSEAERLELVHADSPADAATAYLLAEALLALGELGGAEAVYQAFVEATADDAEAAPALVSLARLYEQQSRVADEVDVLTRLAEASPARARECYHRLAELSLRSYDDEDAVRFAELAVALNPNDASAHARLGDILRRMQALEASVLAYRQALLLDARAFPFYFELAEVYLALHRSGEAEALYREVLDGSDDPALILRAGRRALALREADASVEGLLGVLEARMYDPDKGAAFLHLLVESHDRLSGPLVERARFGEGAAREEARVAHEQLARRSLRPLLEALAGDDVRLREAALRLLATYENPAAAEPIARLMRDGDTALRDDATLAVVKIASPRTVSALSEAARSGEPGLRLLATWGLGRIGDEAAASSLVSLLLDSGSSDRLRALAVASLGRCEGVSPEVLREVLGDRSSEVRRAAAWAVGVQSAAGSVEVLRALLEHGRVDVAETAAWALGRVPERSRAVSLLAEAVFLAPAPVARAASAALQSQPLESASGDELSRFEESLSFFDRGTATFDLEGWLDGALEAVLLVGEEADVSRLPEDAAEALASAWTTALGADAQSRARALAYAARTLASRPSVRSRPRRARLLPTWSASQRHPIRRAPPRPSEPGRVWRRPTRSCSGSRRGSRGKSAGPSATARRWRRSSAAGQRAQR